MTDYVSEYDLFNHTVSFGQRPELATEEALRGKINWLWQLWRHNLKADNLMRRMTLKITPTLCAIYSTQISQGRNIQTMKISSAIDVWCS